MKSHLIVPKQFLLFVSALIFISVACPGPAQASSSRVLILHSYHKGLLWTDKIMDGMASVLDHTGPDLEVHVEYMDTKRHPPKESFDFLETLYRQKFNQTRFDLILASDNNALNFIVAKRAELFGSTPVVFCGINNFNKKMLAGQRDITGVTEEIDIQGTIELAQAILPEVRHIVAINDQTPTGLANREKWKQIVGKHALPSITYVMWDDLSLINLKKNLAALGPDTMVLVFSFHRDNTGHWLSIPEFMKVISTSSSVPVFSFWDHYNDHGSMGGVLVSGREQGRICAEYGTGILKGEAAGHLPIQVKSPNIAALDYRLLKKFNISMSRIPKDTVLLYEPESFFKKYRYLSIIFSILFVILVSLLGVLSVNIFHRRKIEQSLRKSRERLNLIIKGSNDAPWDLDLIDNKIYYSPQWWRQLGYEPDEQETDVFFWLRLLHPDDVDIIDKEYKRAIETDSDGFEIEFRLQHKKGHYLPILSRGIITRDGTKKPVRLTGTNMDLSERKRAEDSLRRSQERFLTILNSIDVSIYVSEINTYEILFMNQHMVDGFGADFTGQVCWSALRGRSGPCRHCKKHELMDKQWAKNRAMTWQEKNPMTRRWYVNYDRVIEWTDGRLVKLQVSTDITEIKRLEEEVRQAHKMESIGILAGGIAHDFNNILGIILGNAELAADGMPQSRFEYELIQEIVTASLRARDVVKQLLSFSRKTKKDFQPLDISPVIRESLKLLRSSLPSSVDIQNRVPAACDTILADDTQIHQVIINLCSNAADAMTEHGGVIEIAVNRIFPEVEQESKYKELDCECYLELTIKDTGTGMEPAVREKMFDPYFTTKETGKGTGMGLAVVHGIVENHGGRIHVDSEQGKGTAISIFFPVVDMRPAGNEDRAIEKLPGGTENILFVDDEPSIVQMTTRTLKKFGYNVTGMTDPVEALSTLGREPDQFDLVVSDMTMPKMNGKVLSKKIKDIRQDIPIIICTGHSSVIEEDGVKETGIAAFEMKPVTMSRMVGLVRDVLDFK